MQLIKYPKVLVEEFSDSVTELGSLHGMSFTLVEESYDLKLFEESKLERSAFIALISSKVSGFVGLLVPRPVLSSSSPVALKSDQDYLEWNKEILNIYSGLVKRRLHKFDIEMVISLPNEFEVKDFATFDEGVGPILTMTFGSSSGPLTFLFSFAIGRNIKFEPVREPNKTSHSPGSGIVF